MASREDKDWHVVRGRIAMHGMAKILSRFPLKADVQNDQAGRRREMGPGLFRCRRLNDLESRRSKNPRKEFADSLFPLNH